jgi:hypothetical protein
MIKKLNSFLEENFKGLNLEPGLFYSWTSSIRFEISPPTLSNNEKEFFEQAFNRSITLFKKVFEGADEIFFVTNVNTVKKDLYIQKRPLNVYKKYVKDKQRLYQLQYQSLVNGNHDEEDDITHQYVLQCKNNDIKYAQLLKAICYEDFLHPSTILKNNQQSGYNIYFVNMTRKIIFHLYDDRGCDVLAADKETIRFLYEQYNGWILDYDRKEIDILFK